VTVFSTTFEVPEKTYTDGSFQLTPPGTNSNADFEYTSDDLSVATIIGDTVIIQGAGQCTITVRQVPTPYYTEQTATAILVVTKSQPTFSLSALGISQGHITIGSHLETTFTMSTKTYGNANIPLGTILSNSPGTKAFSSSNSAVATISGSNIVIAGAGSATISVSQPETANFLARTITATLVVQKRQHALTNFSFVTKTYGDLPFTIVAPTQSDTGAVLSTGAITYSSNSPAIASISGNVITINGPGIATITATQAADVNYLSATVNATFEVLQSSPGNPVQVESVEEVLYVLTTDTPYVQLSNDIILPAVEPGQTYEPLINTGEVPKTFESSDYIIIRRDS
jgi:hypothetical protein